MKYGVNTFIWSAAFGESESAVLPAIKAHGFDGFEAPIFDPAAFPAQVIRRGAEANGLECTICAILPNGLGMGSGDADVRRRSIAHWSDAIRAVAEAGASIVAGPLYSPVGYFTGTRRTQDEWKHAVESFQELGPVAARHGVTLAVEPLNRFETYFLNTAADAVALCDAVAHPNVGILFDTFHANIEEKDVAQGFRTVARHLKHVHTCENDRGTPGTGHVDWDGVAGALRDARYDGWLTIESFGFAIGGLSSAASIWRDIEPSPEVIAWEGIGFLKRKMAGVTAARAPNRRP